MGKIPHFKEISHLFTIGCVPSWFPHQLDEHEVMESKICQKIMVFHLPKNIVQDSNGPHSIAYWDLGDFLMACAWIFMPTSVHDKKMKTCGPWSSQKSEIPNHALPCNWNGQKKHWEANILTYGHVMQGWNI
jgi:hypothetical protein